jgi:nucleotide sugar dehydrogenase
MKDVVGIIGQGFVGSAINETFSQYYNVLTYDKDPSKETTFDNVSDLMRRVDNEYSTGVVFLCLPTPMKRSGECDLSIVRSVMQEIQDSFSTRYTMSHTRKPIVVIKSTVPPGTTAQFNKDYGLVDTVFNPEFLTEANAKEDFKNLKRIILGGPRPATTRLKTMYRKVFASVPIIKTGSNSAEMVKYFTNCFLATKVSFANEMKQICDEYNIDYDKVTEYALYDERIGPTHLSVPGPDGKLGFSGSCFPKDINALRFYAQAAGIDTQTMDGAWKKNLEVRPERDWEKLVGRAISEEIE